MNLSEFGRRSFLSRIMIVNSAFLTSNLINIFKSKNWFGKQRQKAVQTYHPLQVVMNFSKNQYSPHIFTTWPLFKAPRRPGFRMAVLVFGGSWFVLVCPGFQKKFITKNKSSKSRWILATCLVLRCLNFCWKMIVCWKKSEKMTSINFLIVTLFVT
jgi:tryptophan-rich sensory protein